MLLLVIETVEYIYHICIMALLKRTGPYDRARSVVGAVNDIGILHGVY